MLRQHTRTLALAAVAASLCVSTTGTFGARASARAASPTVTLLMEHQWIGSQETYLRAVIARFEKLHPTIRIKESVVADTTKIITALSGGKPPDIVDFGLGQFVPELASKNALSDLGPYIASTRLNLSQFVPVSLQVVTYNRHIYGLPFMNFNHGLLYNKSLFRKAGIPHPPTTLEDLEADAYRLTKVDRSGKILRMGFIPDWPGGGNGQAVNLVDYAWLFGGGWYDARSGQVTANNAANSRALAWETRFYKKYGARNIDNFVKSGGAYLSNDIFASGRLAMAYDGEWWLNFAPPSFVPNIGATPFPAPKGLARLTGTSFIDTNPQVVPAGASHKKEAFAFIAFETTDRAATTYFAQKSFNLPQLRAIPASAVSKDPRYQVFVTLANSPNAHVFPRLSFTGEMDTKVQNVEAAVLHGRGTPAGALQSLQTDLQNSAAGQ